MSKGFDIDSVLEEISQDIEKMSASSSKDIRKNVVRYNYNLKKIEECKTKLNSLHQEIQEVDTSSSSEELINDEEYLKFIEQLDEVKKIISNNNPVKLAEMVNIYKNALNKITKCRDYLENQKIEVVNVD
jgi:hypothetical protein